MLLSRRTFLTAAALSAAPMPVWAQNLSSGDFTHGIASGDPMADRVILWTRFVSTEGRVGWEVADDEAFSRIAARGVATARPGDDFCVKVDASGLQPGRDYYYRFLSVSGPSETGRTKTAPREGAERLTIALFSCANFGYGYFHQYGHAAARADVDLVVHAGDYIYEIQRGAYPSAEEAVPGRAIDPTGETVTLSDYYQRYATYHTDANLLELRRLKPIATVWDDHEFANDAWREGAQAHQTPAEGAWSDRVAAASKAYFDWMPIRRPDANSPRLYRYLDWGGLARILLLDTRYIGRDLQLDYRTQLAPRLLQGGADARAIVSEFRATLLDNPNRTMMGAAQESWFAQSLAQSKQNGQTWQIVAQQVVMGQQLAPAGLVPLLGADISPGTRAWITGGAQLSAMGLPWNLDSWDGYPAARTRFLEACAANANNAIVLGGDSHNCWLNNLAAPSGVRLAAIEFAGGSVSSPGFERALSNAAPGQREDILRSANAQLAFCDLTNRGYGVLSFTRAECQAEWLAFPDIRSPQAQAPAVTRMHAATSAAAGPGAWAR